MCVVDDRSEYMSLVFDHIWSAGSDHLVCRTIVLPKVCDQCSLVKENWPQKSGLLVTNSVDKIAFWPQKSLISIQILQNSCVQRLVIIIPWSCAPLFKEFLLFVNNDDKFWAFWHQIDKSNTKYQEYNLNKWVDKNISKWFNQNINNLNGFNPLPWAISYTFHGLECYFYCLNACDDVDDKRVYILENILIYDRTFFYFFLPWQPFCICALTNNIFSLSLHKPGIVLHWALFDFLF